jgi:hypothetical protein
MGMAVGMAAVLVALACGSVVRPGQVAAQPSGSPRRAGQSPFSPQPGTSVITFIVKPGTDPVAAGRRIGGPGATVTPAYPGREPRENLPMGTLMRTYVVTIPPDQAQQALQRAQADPAVQIAWFGTHLGI